MPRPEKQKLKLMYVKQILEEYTDADHGITMKEILLHLSARGIKAEAKSIYSDIDTLILEGMDIQKAAGRDHTYRLLARQFSIAELKYIIDSIQSSKFLSERTSGKLIAKVETLCSKHEARQLHRNVILTGRVKNRDDPVFTNVDYINEAISSRKQICFQYYDYNIQMHRVYRNHRQFYYRSPYALVYSDDNYYMLAYDEKHNEIRPYRVDRMDKIQVLDFDRIGQEAFDKLDLAQYQKYSFSMFGDNVETVTMRFQNRMMGAVMDRFGRDLMVFKDGDTHFRISVKVAVSDQFYGWVLGLGKNIIILEPSHVVERFLEHLNAVASLYRYSNKYVPAVVKTFKA